MILRLAQGLQLESEDRFAACLETALDALHSLRTVTTVIKGLYLHRRKRAPPRVSQDAGDGGYERDETCGDTAPECERGCTRELHTAACQQLIAFAYVACVATVQRCQIRVRGLNGGVAAGYHSAAIGARGNAACARACCGDAVSDRARRPVSAPIEFENFRVRLHAQHLLTQRECAQDPFARSLQNGCAPLEWRTRHATNLGVDSTPIMLSAKTTDFAEADRGLRLGPCVSDMGVRGVLKSA